MPEQQRKRFPETQLSNSVLFFVFGIVMIFTSQYFETDPLQAALFLIIGAVITIMSASLGVITLLFGLLVWYDRSETSKKITEIIDSASLEKSRVQSTKPAYLLANSFDREVLGTISQVGGDLPNTLRILRDEAILSKDSELISSVAKLITLGLLSPMSKFPYYRVVLTTRGLDALNIPAALFVSNIPNGIWQYVHQMKLKIRDGEWSGAAISMANSIQSMLTERVEEIKAKDIDEWNDLIESLDEKWKNIVKKPLGKWQLGHLQFILRKSGELKQSTFEDYLISELITMRNKVHPPEEGIRANPFLPKDVALMDFYLDILLQMWYGPQ